MSDIAPADLTVLIQVQRNVPDSIRHESSPRQTQDTAEQAKARDAANKFEALLIHNMLKGMRKTTLAENTSSQRALYDDMLDQNLADSMIKAGGLGISEQLMNQLHGPSSAPKTTSAAGSGTATMMTQDRLRLRELALSLKDNPQPEKGSSDPTDNTQPASDTGLSRLKLLSQLWGQAEDAMAGGTQTRHDFVQSLAPHAQRSAQRLGTSTSAVLAIAALETGWGKSMLKNQMGQSSNNYFGIKAGANDRNFTHNTTTEYLNGKSQNVQARFKSYDSTADSVEGFADFILENPRYSTALQHASNPERFLRELHVAGYATDPRYADKVITVMRQVEQQTSKP